MTVAIQGTKGSFSERAAKTIFGKKRLHYCKTFKEVFVSMERGAVSGAVLPIENTLTGSIHENYDHLLKYPVAIIGDGVLRVSHALLAKAGSSLKMIREVWSHPQALMQCSRFIESHPNWRAIPVFDTAGASQLMIKSGLKDVAVIAHREVAALYGLALLQDEIENHRHNFTRFVLLSKKTIQPRGANIKTSVGFGCHDTPGALAHVLTIFADANINLVKLESRPIEGRPFDYLFCADIEGGDAAVRTALEEVKAVVRFYKFLGSYLRFS